MGLMNIAFPVEHAWTSGDVTTDAAGAGLQPTCFGHGFHRSCGILSLQRADVPGRGVPGPGCKGTQMAGTGLEWPMALLSRD